MIFITGKIRNEYYPGQINKFYFLFDFRCVIANSEINTRVQRTSVLPCQPKLAASLPIAVCNKSADRSLQQVRFPQFAASLPFSTCSKSADHNLQQVCRFQLAASLPIAICSKSAVFNLQQVCRSQFAASPLFTICSKSTFRNLQQVCHFQLAASVMTTCSKRDNIKSEQAMRTHPDIGLMIASRSKSAAGLLRLARFWLCRWHCYAWACQL